MWFSKTMLVCQRVSMSKVRRPPTELSRKTMQKKVAAEAPLFSGTIVWIWYHTCHIMKNAKQTLWIAQSCSSKQVNKWRLQNDKEQTWSTQQAPVQRQIIHTFVSTKFGQIKMWGTATTHWECHGPCCKLWGETPGEICLNRALHWVPIISSVLCHLGCFLHMLT